MNIGKRLRELREAKGLSQGGIEKRSGLLRGYVSRVEWGHAPPNLVTLERWSKALGLEMYQIFYQGKAKPVPPAGLTLDRREVKLIHLLRRMPERDKNLILGLARQTDKRSA